VAFRDHSNNIYYFRTYTNMTLQAVDLKKLDLTAGAPARRLSITDTAPGVQMVEIQFHSAGEIASGAVEKTHADR
jgi:penicillin V acylase-like amidase (Ntn superfamily)